MKIEDLLECSPEQLEKMSDDELKKHFDQYFNVTRPERARATQAKKSLSEPTPYMSPGKRKAIAALADMGMDVDFFKKRKKK